MNIRIPRVSLVIILAALPSAAQETRGMIFGRVLDAQSSAVAGATVLVTNIENNASIHLTTNETGYYEANLLLPGAYQVTAEAAGFKRLVRSGIALTVGTRLPIELRLEIGAVTESVLVKAEAPLLETNAVTSGRIMENRSVMQLPVLSNTVMQLVKFSPGLQNDGQNRFFNMTQYRYLNSGYTPGRIGGNEWAIDGVPNIGQDRKPGEMPFTDVVEEFKVETSSFDAAVGHTVGAVVAMKTKSGTNSFHGTVTEQHWQQRWNGAGLFVNQVYYRKIADAVAKGDTALAGYLRSQDKQASGHSNNYAATIGGPVVLPKLYNGKNRLFFFFSFNGFQDNKKADPSNWNRTIPTLANRQGDFSQLLRVDATRYQVYDPLSVRADPARASHYIRDPIPGNVLPGSRIVNPAYKAYAGFLPTPNNDPLQANREPLNNYVAPSIPWNFRAKTFSNRVDYTISGKDRFFGRWGFAQPQERGIDWTFESAPGLHNNVLQRRNRNLIADLVHLFSSSTVLDVSFSTNEYRQGQLPPAKPTAAEVGLPAYLDAKAGEFAALPVMAIAGYQTIGLTSQPHQYFRLFSYKADFMHVRGAHSLRAGFDARQRQQNGSAGYSSYTGAFTFDNAYTRRNDDTFTPAGDLGLSWAAFMLGLPSAMVIASPASVTASTPAYGWYLQDDWRVNKKLSLNLGLRMEYEQGSTERFNRVTAGFDPALALPITTAAQAAYARNPVPELAASQFAVRGGSVYAATGEAGRQMTRGEMMWLPRLGAAWQLDSRTVLRAGYGLFFDTINVLNNPFANGPNIDQTGFSRDTSTNLTNDFGSTWLVGDPRNGASPLRDPFPVRADGTRFDAPLGNALGSMARAGRSWSFVDYNIRRARQQRWRVGLQRQFGNDMVVEIAYAGAYSDHIPISRTFTALPQQYWATGTVRNDAVASNLNSNVANPFLLSNFSDLKASSPLVYADMATNGFFSSATIRKNQLLRTFPQVSSLTANNSFSAGKARAHAMEISFTRRMAKGFSVNAAYTRLNLTKADFYYNEFDAQPSWRPSNDGRPNRFIASGIWELPFGAGRMLARRGPLAMLFGGWQVGWTYEFQNAPLISFGNLFYYGNLGDIAKGPHTLGEWFNTDGFERVAAKAPANFHARVFPTLVDGVRADCTNQWNANLMREVRIKERLRLEVRLDAMNLQNRSQVDAPNTNPLSTDFGRVTAQTPATNRFIQIQGRLQF